MPCFEWPHQEVPSLISNYDICSRITFNLQYIPLILTYLNLLTFREYVVIFW